MEEAFGGRRVLRRSAREEDGAEDNQRQVSNMDRISDLPDELAHHILSFLPSEDVTRSTALSRRWKSICRSFPTVDFDETRFRHLGFIQCREKFLYSMRVFFRRGFGEHPLIQKIRAFAIHPLDDTLKTILNTCIVLSTWKSKLLELDITIDDDSCSTYEDSSRLAYNLSPCVFASGQYLTTLKLKACSCGPFHENMKLPSLKKMSLTYVLIPDEMLQNLITNCPILEDLNIKYCFDMVSLRVFNSKLRRLVVASRGDLMLLEMDVPNLCFFSYLGILPMNHNGENAVENSKIVQLSVPKGSTHFEYLKTVVLSHVNMGDSTFKSMLEAFKFLESVELHFCTIGSMPFNICPRLENLEIQNCGYLRFLVNKETLRKFSITSDLIDRTFWDLSKISLDKLTMLSLDGHIYFESESLDLTSGNCLETVIVTSCDWLINITVAGDLMKSLTLEACYNLEEIAINTPNLQLFKYDGFVFDFTELVIHDDAVVELQLTKKVRFYHEHMLWNFYRMFEVNRFISIDGPNAEAIIVPSRIGLNPPIHFIEKFKVQAVVSGMSYVTFLLEVLHQASCCRTLFLKMIGSISLKLEFCPPPNIAELASCRDQMLSSPKHNCIRHLIKVEIANFEGHAYDRDLVAYLLGTATSLKSLTIGCRKGLPIVVKATAITTVFTLPRACSGMEIKFI